MSAVLFLILRARFGHNPDTADDSKKDEGAAKNKREARDFVKGKGGLVRQSDLEKGSKIDPDVAPTSLGEYIALRESTLEKWRRTKVDVEWEDATVAQAMQDLATRYGLNVLLDPGCGSKPVTFRVEQIEAVQFLDLMTRMGGLAWVVNQAGELWIFPQDKLTTYAPPAWFDLKDLVAAREGVLLDRAGGAKAEPALAKKLRDTAIAGRAIQAGDLYKFLEFLSQVTEMNYVLRPSGTPPQIPMLAPMEGESVDAFLHRALDPVNYAFVVTEDSVIVLSAEQLEAEKKEEAAREEERKGRIEAEAAFLRKTVSIGGEDMSLKDLADALGKALEVPVVIDPLSWRRSARYSFKAVDRTAAEIIAIMKKSAPLEVTLRGGKLWFLAPEDLHEGTAK